MVVFVMLPFILIQILKKKYNILYNLFTVFKSYLLQTIYRTKQYKVKMRTYKKIW